MCFGCKPRLEKFKAPFLFMIATSGGDTDGGNSASGGASGGARGKDRDAVTVPRNTVEEFMAITDGQILVKDYTQSGGWEVAPKL